MVECSRTAGVQLDHNAWQKVTRTKIQPPIPTSSAPLHYTIHDPIVGVAKRTKLVGDRLR